MVIGFDLFGTVFDVSRTPRDELRAYGDTIRDKVWRPFVWPKTWERLPPFADSRMGLIRLQQLNHFVVALSNAPLALSMRMILNAELRFNAIVPLETIQKYKPDPACYEFAAKLCGVPHGEFMMVSGNKDFGDIEAAQKLGMRAQLIRNEGHPGSIIDLAKQLSAR